MPATQRGHARRLPSGKWQLRYYDAVGNRKTGGAFPSKTAALDHYRDVIAPRLHDEGPNRDLTFAAFVEDVYMPRHSKIRKANTIRALRERLARPLGAYGDVPLRDLERMGDDLAEFRTGLPQRFAHDVMRALRQTCAAAVRWGYMDTNPATAAGENPQPEPRTVRAFTLPELNALEDELGPAHGPIVAFAAATGLRPQEWLPLERRHIDRDRRVLRVERVVSNGEIRRGGKTTGSLREVPLSRRALHALDRLPPRLDTTLLFATAKGEPLNLTTWRRHAWTPAVDAAGITRPARIYDLRSTFASNALAAGVTPFELARIMGTSVRMIERSYGTLLGGAHAGIAGRMDAIEAELEQAAEAAEGAR
jgi:integrase